MTLLQFLKFDNAISFWIASFLFVMMAIYLRWLVIESGGWPAVVDYIRYKWLRTRGDGGEITLAFGAVVLGIAVRAGSIALWRATGAHSLDFPYLACAAGDVLMVGGMLCAIRVLAVRRPINWPWMVAAVTGFLFGMLSLVFPLGAVEAPLAPAPVMGDCGVVPSRPRAWLSAAVSAPYDGAVICPAPTTSR